MRRERRWTRVQGRREAVLHRNFSGALRRLGSCCVSLPPAHGRRVTWGPGPPAGDSRRCITCTWRRLRPAGLTVEPRSARVNSGKSSTYGVNRGPAHYRGQRSARRCRRRRPIATGAAPAVTPVTPAAPQVLHLHGRRGLGRPAAGQLPDAPPEGRAEDACLPRHPLRRGARQQGPRGGRHAACRPATRCACRRCAWPSGRPRRRRRRASSPSCSRTSTAGHRQAGRRGGARRQRRELRRASSSCAARGRRRGSSNWCTGSTRRPPACCCWPRSAAR